MLRGSTIRMRRTRHDVPDAGFTLIELMIVISILLILMSISIPLYQQSILHAKEAVLKQDLYTIRAAIDQYTLDKSKAPQSLDDLSQSGYLKVLPKDPFTNKSDTWVVVQEDSILAVDQQQPGISDVHSGATQSAADGTPYSQW
jgi:general secretion pathway protein G